MRRLWRVVCAAYRRYCIWVESWPENVDQEYWDSQFRNKREEEDFWKRQW